MPDIDFCASMAELEGVIALQRLNHASAVARELWQGQGFVTMEYTVAQLQMMSGQYRHVVAKSGGAVIGYALVMLKQHRQSFPFLGDMFDAIEGATHAGQPVRDGRYFVMGQVCIAQAFRGQGIFDLLYCKLREQMQADFDLVITEVSAKNGRSMRAHEQLGFRPLTLSGPPSGDWSVIAWDWQ